MRIAMFFKDNINESFLEKFAQMFGFVIIREVNDNLLKIKEIDYLYPYSDASINQSLIARGFDILEYNNGFTKMGNEQLKSTFYKFINNSRQFVVYKTYAHKNRKITRRINITKHAYEQFRKRFHRLLKYLSELPEKSKVSYERCRQYQNILNEFNLDILRMKKIFLGTNKVTHVSSKLLYRREKTKRNSEYFIDNIFNFVVVGKAIVTVEIYIEELKEINKETSSISNSGLLPVIPIKKYIVQKKKCITKSLFM